MAVYLAGWDINEYLHIAENYSMWLIIDALISYIQRQQKRTLVQQEPIGDEFPSQSVGNVESVPIPWRNHVYNIWNMTLTYIDISKQ